MKTRTHKLTETTVKSQHEPSTVNDAPTEPTKINQRTVFRGRRTMGSQLCLSGFWKALDDAQDSSLLKIVQRSDRLSGRQTDYDLPALVCNICSMQLENSTDLESHILKSHCTVAEQTLCKKVECVPNRVHDMVKKALEEQEAQGIFKIQFMDANNYYLTMPFNHPLAKYLRLFNIVISFNANRIRKSKQWRIFEMKNHKDEIVSVHVNFEPHIADEAHKRRNRIFKTLMHWQDQTEEFVRFNYNALPANGRLWIAECLQKKESVESLLALFKNYEIYEKKKKRGYFIQLRNKPLGIDGNQSCATYQNGKKNTMKQLVKTNKVTTTVQELKTVVKSSGSSGRKNDANGVGNK